MINMKTFICCLYLLIPLCSAAQESTLINERFSIINLDYPGLEEVKKLTSQGKYEDAANALLHYYRNRTNVKVSDYRMDEKEAVRGKALPKAIQEKADNALRHHFQPHKGYGYFDYGKDINWQHWPIKDNEVRWQLHRVTWWQAMGQAYQASGNEEYAKEWVFQFRDWAQKNPLGLSKDNDRYAWRPLEVSERIQSLPATFKLFLSSPNFSPQFLLEFLKSYAEQADYIPPRYTDIGNHLLFEAQRMITAGCFFPELKNATSWRQSGVEVLNREIKKQVYPDGMQFELSPTYHNAAINIFLQALRSMQLSGLEREFPDSYQNTVEKMIMATINFSFPDYSYPMFGDAWLADKSGMLKQFKPWTEVFPNNRVIQYFASEGKQGTLPSYLSHGLTTAGFYTFRNGWKDEATVMVLKASPPGEFHAQPDNGTFELWVKGRNFTPDAGCYVYSGDEEITKLRNWYRQTRVHQTLTLNNENMKVTDAKLIQWKTDPKLDILTYSNPSYPALDHRRSVLFIDRQYFLIIDHASGSAKGNLGIHFQLKEDSHPLFDQQQNSIHTRYEDGNNLLIQNLDTNKSSLTEEEGKVSYVYRQELKRPAFVFEKIKDTDKGQSFITILYPYNGTKTPEIRMEENTENNINMGKLDISLTIDGVKKNIQTTLLK